MLYYYSLVSDLNCINLKKLSKNLSAEIYCSASAFSHFVYNSIMQGYFFLILLGHKKGCSCFSFYFLVDNVFFPNTHSFSINHHEIQMTTLLLLFFFFPSRHLSMRYSLERNGFMVFSRLTTRSLGWNLNSLSSQPLFSD